ncbi:MAG: transglutaminase-like cysteine peptidase [Nitratireductor sp.]|nr:transglutaminase-like cysteine peptidase [Nitratireductor sp.]
MTKTSAIMLAVAVCFGLLGTTAGEAAQGEAHMVVTGRTTQPIGHYEYCKQYPADCNIRSTSTGPVRLTKERWNEITSVNDTINRKITPVTDMELYNVEEFWTYSETYGDCEDYVLLKRHMLMQMGWPASSLLVTVVRQPNGDGHAVLTVRTDRADYVLDNLDDRVLPWMETEYRFLKRQSAANSGRWEGIDDNRNAVVGSVR